MKDFKDPSRKLARERFWNEHDRDTYECPDCGRTEEELRRPIEVHHNGGNAFDNRLNNLVGLCRLCHNLREGKKPSTADIRHLREQVEITAREDLETEVEKVYMAGAMNYDTAGDDPMWRATLEESDFIYEPASRSEWLSPEDVAIYHGAGPVNGIAGADMEMLESADAVVGYIEKDEQVGTLTEVMYAVGRGFPVLLIINTEQMQDDYAGFSDPKLLDDGWVSLEEPLDNTWESEVYWFLVNALVGDVDGFVAPDNGWEGVDNAEVVVVEDEKYVPIAVSWWLKKLDTPEPEMVSIGQYGPRTGGHGAL